MSAWEKLIGVERERDEGEGASTAAVLRNENEKETFNSV